MNISRFTLLFGFASVFALTAVSCRHEKNELAHHHHHGEAEEAAAHAGHDHDHGETSVAEAHSHADEIVLDQHKAERLGVTVTEVSPADFAEVVTVSGELAVAPSAQSTVTARSAGIVHLSAAATPGSAVSRGQAIASVSGEGISGGDSNEAARVALQAAKRELERIAPLHADGIVSTRDYNAALRAYEEAKAAAGTSTSAGSTAVAPTAGVVAALLVEEGQYVAAGEPIARISASDELTLRANLPESSHDFLPSVSGARFRTAYGGEVYDIAEFRGHRSSRSGVAQQGYIPVYFTLKNPGGVLSAGSFCEVYLQGATRKGVIALPVEALSEQQGEFFVYVQVHPDAYDKRRVRLGADAGDRVEILSGLKPGEKVVTGGTTFVRLAETSGAVPEGHSHNH